MTEEYRTAQPDVLTDLPVPALSQEQLNRFTRESMHVEALGAFDLKQTVEKLNAQEGKVVAAADFGGDKGTSLLFTIKDGFPSPTDGYEDKVQGDDGNGYVASLQKTAAFAEANQIPMGISWGGPLEGSKMLFHPKATVFIRELEAAYGGDLRAISPNIAAVMNDGPAGLISGAVEAYREFQASTVLFVINGGGIGLAVLNDGVMYATEAGHVEGLEALNTYSQTTPCGVFGAEYVCLERLGANKAGIEAQWEAKTGAYMRARDIEDRYKAGDELARDLYDHSALVIAHILQGAANSLGIDLASKDTAVVAHGGAFKFPGYGARVAQILGNADGTAPQLLLTKDYTNEQSNACLDGAAIAAITA